MCWCLSIIEVFILFASQEVRYTQICGKIQKTIFTVYKQSPTIS